ncbi:MAG: YebC/PmpR family DNA-binding transcriptional regulator, partial [Cyanobacteriota bacterium SKYGB_h_bin112]|nr:YebC/PmpR family DNA-binding transcriptional regulator [Cyanobacteriota bacterium SKYGB_h_bin112]
KARVDAVKGKIFTKISREIIVAARSGIPDPAGNFQLRTAIEKAKAAGIPNENIERAIAKGAGKLGTDGNLEAIQYEGYGPGGVAIIMEALTDNRNRTAADLRATLSKYGGNLGETGCVGWLFQQRGIVLIVPDKPGVTLEEDVLLELCLDIGADSYNLVELEEDEPAAELVTDVPNLEQASQLCKARGYAVRQAEPRWIPLNTVAVTDPDQAKSLLKLMDALDDLDDIQSVTANFEMSDALMGAEV